MNRERDGDGDYLVHLAVRGGEPSPLHDGREKMNTILTSLSLFLSLPPSPTGLPQLPLLYALVSTFRADVSLRNGEGLTPLCLAAKLGEEKLAEVGSHMYITIGR